MAYFLLMITYNNRKMTIASLKACLWEINSIETVSVYNQFKKGGKKIENFPKMTGITIFVLEFLRIKRREPNKGWQFVVRNY